MSLVQTVITNTLVGFDGNWSDPNGKVFKDEFTGAPFRGTIATSCHFATVYWLFLTEFNREPTEDDIADIGAAEQAVLKMLPHGIVKQRPKSGNLELTAGSILVFGSPTKAGHSCVAIDTQVVSGYNQTGWWKKDGHNHGYSTHMTAELHWGDGANKNQVFNRSNNQWYALYEIPETKARKILHSLAT